MSTIDPLRDIAGKHGTGIYVRAERGGKWGNADIVELTTASLLTWLRSRGQRNDWAESTVCILLGHSTDAIDAAVKELEP